MKLVVTEYLKKDEVLEVFEGKCNNAWVHKKDGTATIYANVFDMSRAIYRNWSVPRKICKVEELDTVIKQAKDYEDIKLTEDRT